MGYWDHREGRYRLFSDKERKEFGERKRDEWHSKYVSRSTLIRYHGWIDEAVDEFLKPVKAGPIYAFLRSAVEKIEQRDDFRQWIADTKAARKKLPRKKKAVDPNKERYSKPIKALPVRTEHSIPIYDAACPRCNTTFTFFVGGLDIPTRGVAYLHRRCKECAYDVGVRLNLNKHTIQLQLPSGELPSWWQKGEFNAAQDQQKTAHEIRIIELAAIDKEMAELERELEPIERERCRIKERYTQLESRKFGLLKYADKDRLRKEAYRDWD